MIRTFATMSICVIITLGANLSLAQNNTVGAASWGDSVQDVQLSIAMTNKVYQIGSSAIVQSVTKNSSTNVVAVDVSFPLASFDVALTNSAGKLYHVVSTPAAIAYPTVLKTLNPGEESAESIPVTFGENIEPGDYFLRATRHFGLSEASDIHSREGMFTLESNSIKVQIIK